MARRVDTTPELDLRIGEILAVAAGGRVSVRVDGSALSLPIVRGYTAQVGDQCVVLIRRRLMFVVGALGTAPILTPPPVSQLPPPPADDPTPGAPVNGSSVFQPVSTGTYRNGAWRGDTNDLYQGDWSGRGINTGAAFYGGGPHGLRGATCTRVRVRLRREAGGVYGGQSPTLKLWTEKARSGAPNEENSTGGPSLTIGETSTFTLPLSWGQKLIDGDAGGIGIKVGGSTPYIRLNGPSMALLIDWQRT